MAMQTDVKSATVGTSSGTAVSGRVRVKSLVITSTATAGSVTLKDGGSSGVTMMVINTPAVAGLHNVLLPGEGIVFTTDVYVALSNATYATVMYG